MSKEATEHHRKAAEHHEHAARHHKEAAKHHDAGAHEKAAFRRTDLEVLVEGDHQLDPALTS